MERHVRQFPERTALRWSSDEQVKGFDGNHLTKLPTTEITYKNFNDLITRTAGGLLKLGIDKGDRVILFLPMGLPMYTAMFAIMRIGAIAVFLDSWARRNHLGASGDCVAPKAMISHSAAFDLVGAIPSFDNMPLRILAGPGGDDTFSARLEDLFESTSKAPITAVESESTALITFTTGSSGVPKGANRTHRFLCAQHEALWNVIPYTENDIDMPAFPIFSLNNLASGVSTLLPALDLAKPSDRDPAVLTGQIINQAVTCTTLSPAMFNGLSSYCHSQKTGLPSLRRVVTGGAPISRDNVRSFKSIAPDAEIWILYGSTEVEPMAHIESNEMLSTPSDPDPEIIEQGVNVGHISKELRYKFITPSRDNITWTTDSNWQDLEVAAGQVGEFIVSGNHVCRDYYNNPEAFQKTKIVDGEKNVWHRTGDLGLVDDRGHLRIVGRIHNMIIRRGTPHFPVGPEIILKRLDFVNRSAYLGLADPDLGERCVVALQLKEKEANIPKGLKELKRLFTKNSFPVDACYIVNEIPMDPRHHSKVEYSVLRRLLLDEKPDNLLA
jgi:olefin beta-lactone synthetase